MVIFLVSHAPLDHHWSPEVEETSFSCPWTWTVFFKSQQLKCSWSDSAWLLRLDHEMLGLPPRPHSLSPSFPFSHIELSHQAGEKFIMDHMERPKLEGGWDPIQNTMSIARLEWMSLQKSLPADSGKQNYFYWSLSKFLISRKGII